MNPTQDNDADDQLQNVANPLKVMQPGERVICEIKRHPIGLFGVYAITAIVMAVLIAIAILTPYYATFITVQQRLGVVLSAGVAIIITLLFAYISVFIYRANRWVVTSDSVTEMSQTGLFNKQTRQISLANLEDVTVDHDGVLQTLLNYGNLVLESAGEGGKFIFTFCPDPHEYAKQVIAAHEAYIAVNPEEMRAFNRPLANVKSFNQPGPGQQPPTA